MQVEEDVRQKLNVRISEESVQEGSGTQETYVQRQHGQVIETDILQEEFRQKCKMRKETLWKELQQEARLGVSDIKCMVSYDLQLLEFLKIDKSIRRVKNGKKVLS